MAFIFSEPMTGYSAAMDLVRNKWTGNINEDQSLGKFVYTVGTGRFTGGSIKSAINCNLTRPFLDQGGLGNANIFVQVMVKWDVGSLTLNSSFLQLKNNGGVDIALTLQRTTNNELVALDDTGMIAGTSAVGVVTPGVWQVVTVVAEIGSDSGSLELYVDDFVTPVISVSGVAMNLDGVSNYLCDAITFVQPVNQVGAVYNVSELFVYDTLGTTWNSLIGDKYHIPLVPQTLNASANPFTPSSGPSGHLMVDDPLSALSDDGATYNIGNYGAYLAAPAGGFYDQFDLSDLPPNTTGIIGVLSVLTARKSSAAPEFDVLKHRIFYTFDSSADLDVALTDEYLDYQAMFPKDPTFADWTVTSVNALDGGYGIGNAPA